MTLDIEAGTADASRRIESAPPREAGDWPEFTPRGIEMLALLNELFDDEIDCASPAPGAPAANARHPHD